MFSSIFALLLQSVVGAEPPASSTDSLPAVEQAAEAPAASPEAAQAEEPAVLVLPKAYEIVIAIDAQVGSKISTAGQMFPIRLAQAVEMDGTTLLPAGITGEGQVVHAKKAGMAGSAGELILAARYLDYAGRRIELRSFRFIEEGDEILSRGQNNVDLASATNAAIGPLGFFIGGGNTTIEPGTLATAKTKNDESFAVAAESPVSPDADN